MRVEVGEAARSLSPSSARAVAKTDSEEVGFLRRTDPIRVAIVDDDPQSSAGTKAFLDLSPEYRSVGVFSNVRSARAGIPSSNPALVLMDILMPDGCGIECARFLKSVLPRLVIVMVTGLDGEDLMVKSLRAGATGYLAKPFGPVQFQATLKFAVAQLRHPHDFAQEVLGNSGSRRDDLRQLTAREQVIMECLSAGLLYKEIAEKLGASIPVVHKLQHRIYLKLQVSNRMEAVDCWRNVCRVHP